MKLSHLISTSLVAVGLLAGSAFAGTIKVSSTDYYHENLHTGHGGGEIWAETSDHGSFLTFCLEKGVPISAGTTYTYDVGPAAVNGGPNDDLNEMGFDTISNGTAWLYLAFSNNTLGAPPDGTDSYSGPDRLSNSALLQLAIWALEDEIDWDTENYYLGLFANNSDWAKSNYSGNEVAVVNPWLGREDRQSLLVRVPDGGTSAVLLGLGLISVALMRRRK